MPFKNESKSTHTANKMVYVESVRKLLKDYNNTHDGPVSLNTSFYFQANKKKEKQSCLLLQPINRYLVSGKLKPHKLLIVYIQKLKLENKFQELDDDKPGTFHKHDRVHESCTKKDGTSAEYRELLVLIILNLPKISVNVP